MTKQDKDSDILYNYIADAKRTLRILITKKCNLNCLYCYEEGIQNSTNKSLQKLDVQDFKNIIRSAKRIGIYRISFSGGEPTIYSSMLDELIGICISLDIMCTVTTNGSSAEILTLAKKYPTLNIRISLDFYTAKEYFSHKKVDCFAVVVDNLNALIALNNPIHINRIVFSLENEWAEFNKMIDFIIKNELNKQNVVLKLLPAYPNAVINKLSVNALMKYYMDNGVSFDKKQDSLRNKNKPYFSYKNVNVCIQTRGIYSPKCCIENKSRCVEGIGSMRINPDGVIQPCFGVTLGKINHNDKLRSIINELKKSHKFLDGLYVKGCAIDDRLSNR